MKATVVRLTLMAALASSLAACRPGEQDRPLEYSPGVYQGATDEKLSAEQDRQLRERANLMR